MRGGDVCHDVAFVACFYCEWSAMLSYSLTPHTLALRYTHALPRKCVSTSRGNVTALPGDVSHRARLHGRLAARF